MRRHPSRSRTVLSAKLPTVAVARTTASTSTCRTPTCGGVLPRGRLLTLAGVKCRASCPATTSTRPPLTARELQPPHRPYRIRRHLRRRNTSPPGSECVEVQPSAVRGVGRDHGDARDELHIHCVTVPAVIRLPAIVAACFRHCRGPVRVAVCQNARLLLPAQAGEGSLPDHVPTTSDSSAPNCLFRR